MSVSLGPQAYPQEDRPFALVRGGAGYPLGYVIHRGVDSPRIDAGGGARPVVPERGVRRPGGRPGTSRGSVTYVTPPPLSTARPVDGG